MDAAKERRLRRDGALTMDLFALVWTLGALEGIRCAGRAVTILVVVLALALTATTAILAVRAAGSLRSAAKGVWASLRPRRAAPRQRVDGVVWSGEIVG